MSSVTPMPRGDARILYNGDLGLPIRFVYSDTPAEEDLYAIPDDLAGGGVDVVLFEYGQQWLLVGPDTLRQTVAMLDSLGYDSHGMMRIPF